VGLHRGIPTCKVCTPSLIVDFHHIDRGTLQPSVSLRRFVGQWRQHARGVGPWCARWTGPLEDTPWLLTTHVGVAMTDSDKRAAPTDVQVT